MKLLLDEMISWRITADCGIEVATSSQLSAIGPRSSRGSIRPCSHWQRPSSARSSPTNVRDYRAAHERMRVRGEDHYGVVYTYDDRLPRNKAAFPLWVSTLQEFLEAHWADDTLLNREHHLLP